jgi:hypothetical protein
MQNTRPASKPDPPGSDAWLANHGILREVWAARPYVRYSPDDLEPVRAEYGDLVRGQRRFASMIANGGRNPYRDQHPETQAGGFLIMRHPPPGMDLPKVYAEMRPDNPVATAPPVWEYHGPKRYPSGLSVDAETGRPLNPVTGKPLSDGNVHSEAWALRSGHFKRDKYADDHHGDPFDPRLLTVHCHQNIAKYCFIPGAWVDQSWQDADGGWHTRRVKDRSESIARRLDMHPFAAERLASARRVWFIIEGCLKSDAALSWLITNGCDDETVASVPSVTLWRAPELERFTDLYLQGKQVVIVCDADGWRSDQPNQAVQAQSMMLRSFLRWRISPGPNHEFGAVVAAPPFDPDDLDGSGKPTLNGVDDHLGAGKSLGELEVVGLEPPSDTFNWILTHPREGQQRAPRLETVRNEAAALEGIALHGGTAGVYRGTIENLAGICGLHDIRKPPPSKVTLEQYRERINNPDRLPASYDQIWDALRSLESRGAIRREGSLDAKRNRWGQMDWESRPTFTILDEALRAKAVPRRTLADTPAVAFYNAFSDALPLSPNVEEIEGMTDKAILERLERIEHNQEAQMLHDRMSAEAIDCVRALIEERFPAPAKAGN